MSFRRSQLAGDCGRADVGVPFRSGFDDEGDAASDVTRRHDPDDAPTPVASKLAPTKSKAGP
jgi:hypothetical protein